jgi:general secretion pathway protein E
VIESGNYNATLIPTATLQQARGDAERSRRHVVEVLADMTRLDHQAVMHSLGLSFHYPVLSMDDINLLTPAFDVIDFSNAVERNAIAFRNAENQLIVVFGNPFDARLQSWAEDYISESFTWHLAQPSNISAFLSRQEESMRAMDSILGPEDDIESAVKNVQELSIKSISEDTSPVMMHSALMQVIFILKPTQMGW